MTKEKRTLRDKILTRLKLGQSRRQIADFLGISYQTVRTVADSAERAGLIVRYPDAYPILYYDPAGKTSGYGTNYQGVGAVDHAKNLRESRIHLNGFFSCEVIHVGEIRQINHDNKIALYWRNESSQPDGCIDHYGTYRTDGQSLTFRYRKGTTSLTFAFWAGSVIVSGANAMARGGKLLKQRAEWVVSVLRTAGWRLTEPVMKGALHSGKVNAPFAQYCAGTVDDNAPLQVDRSTGEIEAEVFNDEDNDIISYLPEHIREMRARIGAMESITDKLITVTENLTRALAETTSHITTLVASGQTSETLTDDKPAPGVMYK